MYRYKHYKFDENLWAVFKKVASSEFENCAELLKHYGQNLDEAIEAEEYLEKEVREAGFRNIEHFFEISKSADLTYLDPVPTSWNILFSLLLVVIAILCGFGLWFIYQLLF